MLLCEGDAVEIMENVSAGEGPEAWRHISNSYELNVPGRFAGQLLEIMEHALPIGDKLRGSFETFEAKCKPYHAHSGEAFCNNARTATA